MGNKHSSAGGLGLGLRSGGSRPGKRKYKVPANAEPPEAPSQPFAQPVDEDSVYLEWSPPSYDGGCPVFGYFIQFKATSAEEYTTMGPIAETSAYVRNLEFGVYNFRIVAENLLGYSDASEPSEDLVLGGEECGPSFLKELDEVAAVVEGGVVSLVVRAAAKPQPVYTWFYNDIELVPSPNIEPRGGRLILRSVPKTMRDGAIKCRAANVHGAIDTVTKLVVGVAPEIKRGDGTPDSHAPPHIFARVGEPLRLRFPISGHPTPAILWTHNGIVVNRHEIQSGLVATLKIDNIQREDRGEYELTVQNEFGMDRLAVLVTVADRPAAPRAPPRINLQKDDSCLVEWDWDERDRDDDGGCEIGGFIVEYYRVGWDCWLSGATTTKRGGTGLQKTARLKDLIPGSRYMFRVKAENPYGISEPSPQTGVLFIPDRSSGIMGPLEESIDEQEDEDVSEPTQSTVIETKPRKPEWANPKITIEPGGDDEPEWGAGAKANGYGYGAGFGIGTPKTTRTAEEEPRRLSVNTSPYPRSRSPSPNRSPGGSPRNARRLSSTPNALDHYHDPDLVPGGAGTGTGGGSSLGLGGSSEGVYGLLKRHSLNTAQFPTDTIKVAGASQTGRGGVGSLPQSHQIYETDSEGEASDFGEVIEVKSSLTLSKSGCSIQTSKERLDSGRTSRASLEMDLETAKELLMEDLARPQAAPVSQNQSSWTTFFFAGGRGGSVSGTKVEQPEIGPAAQGRSKATLETASVGSNQKLDSVKEHLRLESREPVRDDEVKEYDSLDDLELHPVFVPMGLGQLALNYGTLILIVASLFVKYLNLFVSLLMLLVAVRALWRLN